MEIGINKIKTRNVVLHTYTELNDEDKTNRPDGLIVITSGKYNPVIEWAGFVEVKIKNNEINDEQIENYTDFARDIGINDIITISNYLVANPTQTPVKTKKRNFNLYHWSWVYLKVTASRLIKTDKIEDEDHIYILKEFRRYFDNHKNLKHFDNMGQDWKNTVNQIHTLNIEQKIDNEMLSNIVEVYAQEEKDISLHLTDKSNYHVELLAKDNRLDELQKMLLSCKVITSEFMINKNKKNTFFIDVDFIKQEIRCYTHIIIEKGKAQAQTTVLIKMFEENSGYTDNILVNGYYIRNKTKNNHISLSQLIEEKNNSEKYSILDKDLGDKIKFFELKTKDLLGKHFNSPRNFIVQLESIAYRFLTQVMSNR